MIPNFVTLIKDMQICTLPIANNFCIICNVYTIPLQVQKWLTYDFPPDVKAKNGQDKLINGNLIVTCQEVPKIPLHICMDIVSKANDV